MNKTTAIKTARANVGDLYKFGDNYRFNYWDDSISSWRESIPLPYYQAQFHRSCELIYQAVVAMGESKDNAYYKMSCYFAGSWIKYI